MTGTESPGPADPSQLDLAQLDLAQLSQDWLTVWQSECAGILADREAWEHWRALMAVWAGAAASLLQIGADAARYARREPAAGAASAADSPRPRPLMLHLMLAAMKSANSAAAWRSWNNVFRLWSEAASSGPANLAEAAPPEALQALLRDLQNDQALIGGIAAYRRHPYNRRETGHPELWRQNEARLIDYAPGSAGTPVVLVPSLINRGYILDLAPDNSLTGYLAEAGLRPMLLDWGWPGEAERRFTLTDYIAGLLESAIAAAGRPVILAGYCMGGLLALAAALRRPDLVRAVALLATPWDFRAHDPDQADRLARLVPLLQPVLDFSSTLPIDALQSLFAMLDPGAVGEKFRRFARMDQQGKQAERFVALEDWANDGVPLAAPVARECLGDWYGRNAPLTGEWRVAGLPVVPANLRMPAFVAIPGKDRIVPPASARPLATLIPDAASIEPEAGHIGMVAGGRAESALWRPLRDWIFSVGNRLG